VITTCQKHNNRHVEICFFSFPSAAAALLYSDQGRAIVELTIETREECRSRPHSSQQDTYVVVTVVWVSDIGCWEETSGSDSEDCENDN
jgi:hypothetical protein